MKVVLLGGFGVPNLGDEAILSAILDYYSEVAPGSTINVVTISASLTRMIHARDDVTCVPTDAIARYLLTHEVRFEEGELPLIVEKYVYGPLDDTDAIGRLTLQKIIMSCDLLHFAGGGYLYFRFGRAMAAVLIEFAEIYGKPVVLTGTTLGVLGAGDGMSETERHEATMTLKRIIRGARIVDMRDEIGRDLVASVRPDFTISCDDVFASRCLANLPSRKDDRKSPVINVQINGELRSLGESWENAANRLVSTFGEALRRGLISGVRCLLFDPQAEDGVIPLLLRDRLGDVIEICPIGNLPFQDAMCQAVMFPIHQYCVTAPLTSVQDFICPCCLFIYYSL